MRSYTGRFAIVAALCIVASSCGSSARVQDDDTFIVVPYFYTAANDDLAFVLGPSGISAPSPEYVDSAYANYLVPSGIYDGPLANVQALTTDEATSDTATSLAQDESQINATIVPLLADGHSITLFGYSQSTAAISEQLNLLATQYPGQLSYVFVGDSASPYGMLNNIYDSLPSWAQIMVMDNLQTWDLAGVLNLGAAPSDVLTTATQSDVPGAVYTIIGDGFADWPNIGNPLNGSDSLDAVMQAATGIFIDHDAYMGLTAADYTLDPALTVGDAHYFLTTAPTDLLGALISAATDVGWL